jgi:hypothetical protein
MAEVQERFGNVSEQYLLELLEKNTPNSTQNSRKVWLWTYVAWYKEKKLEKEKNFTFLSITEVDRVLNRFILEVRIKRRKKYALSSLAININALITSYNKTNRLNQNFWKNPILVQAHVTLDTELKLIHSTKFKSKEQTLSFTEKKINLMLDSLHCSIETADDLNKQLYILILQQLGCHISCMYELEWTWFEDNKWKKIKDKYITLILPRYPNKNYQGGIVLLRNEKI